MSQGQSGTPPADNEHLHSRRNLLKGFAAATAVPLLPVTAHAHVSADRRWDNEADVLIVGTGAAGLSAALAAVGKGASVILFDKMPFQGGTTAKSGGVFWIPNNPGLQAKGVKDDRLGALRYMARLAHPTRYAPGDALLGLTQDEFDLIAAFYDNGARVVTALATHCGLKAIPWATWEEQDYPDYYADIAENTVHSGRSLVPDSSDDPDAVVWPKNGGAGPKLVQLLTDGLKNKPAQILLDHHVLDLVRDHQGRVIGLTVDRGDKAPAHFRARKGVVFASGGFTHNQLLASDYLRGRIWGGCAAPGSTGDFIPIATRAGAALGNMSHAWWGQIPVEVALKTPSVAATVWSTPGDSVIQVNRYGKRFVNEKIQYNERTQAHFYWDAVRAEYPNLLGFMIWDARTAELYAGYDPIPAANARLSQIISADSLAALTTQLKERLARMAAKTGGFTLDEAFLENLEATIARYNGFARSGKDDDFSRGEAAIETAFQFMNAAPAENPYPNRMMHPLADKGPYHAVILGAGTLDTKGGPVVNPRGQVLGTDGKPIAGLYAAGNCVAHPAGQAYWAGGGTLGPALTFGWLAGEAVSDA